MEHGERQPFGKLRTGGPVAASSKIHKARSQETEDRRSSKGKA